MAVKMRLRREGKKKQPYYRVVVADVRSPRDGRYIEDIGYYQPLHEPSTITIDRERALYWLRNGVQPTEAVTQLLRIQGIWDEFKPGDSGKGQSVTHAQRAEGGQEPDRRTAEQQGAQAFPQAARADAVQAEQAGSESEDRVQ